MVELTIEDWKECRRQNEAGAKQAQIALLLCENMIRQAEEEIRLLEIDNDE